jgi:hypothetical protein
MTSGLTNVHLMWAVSVVPLRIAVASSEVAVWPTIDALVTVPAVPTRELRLRRAEKHRSGRNFSDRIGVRRGSHLEPQVGRFEHRRGSDRDRRRREH